MKIHRAILLVVTFLIILNTAVSDQASYPIARCTDVFNNFMPCMGYVEGIYHEPSPECCRGVSHLNNVVKFTRPGSSDETSEEASNEQIERVCECIEIMGNANHLPFLPNAIQNLPPLCSLTLSFPISVAMDCPRSRITKVLDAGKLN